jgi:hypothetical protein
MEQNTIQNLSALKGELLEPCQSSKPIIASSFELRPGFIAMVRDQAFSGLDYENPYHHLREFEQLLCLPDHLRHVTRNIEMEVVSLSLNERGSNGTLIT